MAELEFNLQTPASVSKSNAKRVYAKYWSCITFLLYTIG